MSCLMHLNVVSDTIDSEGDLYLKSKCGKLLMIGLGLFVDD